MTVFFHAILMNCICDKWIIHLVVWLHRDNIVTSEQVRKLNNSNYTRYHIELINDSCDVWLVSTML